MGLLNDFFAETRFVCGIKIPKFECRKYKSLEKYQFFVDHRESCEKHVTGWYFDEKKSSDVFCGFCLSDLSTEVIDIFEETRKIYTAVVPNCGRKQCLEKKSLWTSRFRTRNQKERKK